MVIPDDYSRNLALGKEAQVQLLFDGSDSNTATTALGYAEGLVAAYSQKIQQDAQRQRAGAVIQGGVDARIRVWYNPDLVSRNFIVPGLIAVILMIIVANLSSLTIAREWENGTMEQLLSTPVRPAEMALGKLSAYFMLGMLDMLICLFVGVFIFDVPFKGNIFTLMISSCVFLFGGLACGILISAANRTQLMAYQMGSLTSFLPAFLLSGFIYPIANMPQDHSGDRSICAGAIFHQHSERPVFEGRCVLHDLVRFPVTGRLWSPDVFLRDAQTAGEGGVTCDNVCKGSFEKS